MQDFHSEKNKRQLDVISAYQEHFKNKSGAEDLNQNGICMALSMAFCHSQLMQSQGQHEQGYFDLFLENFHTADGIEKFFKKLDTLTLEYQLANREEQASLLPQLQTYWSQLAIINLALLLYAQSNKPYSIRIWATPSRSTCGYAGLTCIGVMKYNLSISMLEDLFFEPDPGRNPSVLSPFAPGGTYLIATPGHLCAAYMNKNGELIYYDPNYHIYIKNKEELQSYLNIFQEEILGDAVCISVFAVRLKNLGIEQNALDLSVQQQLRLSGEYFWAKKNYLTHDPQKMIQNGLFQILCHLSDARSLELFSQTLDQMTFDDIELAMLEFFAIDLGEENYPLVDRVLTDRLFRKWLQQDSHFIKKIFRYPNFNLMTYILSHLPEGVKLGPDNLSALAVKMKQGLQLGNRAQVSSVIEILFEKNLIESASCLEDALAAMFDQAHIDKEIAELAVVYCQKYIEKNGVPEKIILGLERGLASYLITHDYSNKIITDLLQSPCYIWHPSDYHAVLCGANDRWKQLVAEKLLEQQGIFDNNINPLVLSASRGYIDEIIALLEQNFWLSNELAASLQYAASQGYTDICRVLVVHDILLIRQKSFNDAIKSAVKNGRRETVIFLLGCLPNTQLKEGAENAFKWALSAGQKKLAVFLQQEYDLSFELAYEHFSDKAYGVILTGQVRAVEAFIAVGIEGHYLDMPIDGFRETCLTEAIFAGQYDIASILIEAGASVHIPGFNYQPLMAATIKGNQELVSRLIAKGADLDAQNQDGDTALMFALKKGWQEIVRLLISHKASVNIFNSAGQNALFFAVRSRSIESLAAIVEAGSDINLPDYCGQLPVLVAVKLGNKKAFNYLIAKGAQLPSVNNIEEFLKFENYSVSQIKMWQREVIKAALTYGRSDILGSFRNDGILIDASDKIYLRSLKSAVFKGHHLALELFLLISTCLPDLNTTYERSGHTLLTYAVERRHLDTARVLLKRGAEVNKTNNMGYSAIYLAVFSGCENMLNLLIEHQSDLDMPDLRGRTPLMIALASKNLKLVYKLLQSGARVQNFHILLAIVEVAYSENHNIKRDFCQKVTSIALEYGQRHLLEEMIRAKVLFDFYPSKKELQEAISKNYIYEVTLFILNLKHLSHFHECLQELLQLAESEGREELFKFFKMHSKNFQMVQFNKAVKKEPMTGTEQLFRELLKENAPVIPSERSESKLQDSCLIRPITDLTRYVKRK